MSSHTCTASSSSSTRSCLLQLQLQHPSRAASRADLDLDPDILILWPDFNSLPLTEFCLSACTLSQGLLCFVLLHAPGVSSRVSTSHPRCGARRSRGPLVGVRISQACHCHFDSPSLAGPRAAYSPTSDSGLSLPTGSRFAATANAHCDHGHAEEEGAHARRRAHERRGASGACRQETRTVLRTRRVPTNQEEEGRSVQSEIDGCSGHDDDNASRISPLVQRSIPLASVWKMCLASLPSRGRSPVAELPLRAHCACPRRQRRHRHRSAT